MTEQQVLDILSDNLEVEIDVEYDRIDNDNLSRYVTVRILVAGNVVAHDTVRVD